jgi:nitroreductase
VPEEFDADSVLYAIYHTRAMRRLKADPVPEDLLLKLVDAANQAPSGSNAQNGRWIVVRDPQVKAQLAELNKTAVDRYSQSFNANVPGQDPEARMRLLRSVQWQADHLAEIPALIIACLEMGGPPPDRWAAGAGAGGSIWPGVQNLLLAARAFGLGAAPTTLGLSNRPAAKEALGLPENIEPFCLIPVGWPMGRFGPVTRRPVEEIMRWDRWS